MEEQQEETNLMASVILKYLEGGKSIDEVAQAFEDEINRVIQEAKKAEEEKEKALKELKKKNENNTDFTMPVEQSPLLNDILAGINEAPMPIETMSYLYAFYLAQNYPVILDEYANEKAPNQAYLQACGDIIKHLDKLAKTIADGARIINNLPEKEEFLNVLDPTNAIKELYNYVWNTKLK